MSTPPERFDLADQVPEGAGVESSQCQARHGIRRSFDNRIEISIGLVAKLQQPRTKNVASGLSCFETN